MDRPYTVGGVRHPLPAVPLAIAFINAINQGDVPALVSLMTADHRLQIFDEPPVVGRDANQRTWTGYLESFSSYLIYPRRIADCGHGVAAVLGHTTGSHLGLSDAEEAKDTLIWLAETTDGAVAVWTLVEDSPLNRARYGLDAQPM
jgi:SnoaL-like domain